MPLTVAWFEKIMYLDIAISVILALNDYGNLTEEEALEVGAAYQTFVPLFFAVLVLLVWLTARRRMGWGRWFLLAVVASSELTTVYDAISGAAASSGIIISALHIITFALEVAAMVLIFSGSARSWFRSTNPI